MLVTPAEAGAQGFHEERALRALSFLNALDSRLRGNDGESYPARAGICLRNSPQ
jgi:hypothetical protein